MFTNKLGVITVSKKCKYITYKNKPLWFFLKEKGFPKSNCYKTYFRLDLV